MARFTGTAGVDSFIGTDLAPDLFIFRLEDLAGTDRLVGGSGMPVDILRFTSAGVIDSALFASTSGLDRIELANGNNSLVVSERMVGGAIARQLVINGGDGNDVVDGSSLGAFHRVNVTAGAGNDILRGGASVDTFQFCLADFNKSDTVAGGGFFDMLRFSTAGTLQAAAFARTNGIEEIQLAGGVNRLTIGNNLPGTNGGHELSVRGNTGRDAIDASLFNAVNRADLEGLGGNDVLRGGRAGDILDGGTGDDVLVGGPRSDVLFGGPGADRFLIDRPAHHAEFESINGGRERVTDDTLVLTAPGVYDLQGIRNIDALAITGKRTFTAVLPPDIAATADANNDSMAGDLEIRALGPFTGSATIDALRVFSGRLNIIGANFKGNDTFTGGVGADRIEGGAGDDTIRRGGGVDYLAGGLGSDRFVYGLESEFSATETINGTAEQPTLDYLQIHAGPSTLSGNIRFIDVVEITSNAGIGYQITVSDAMAGTADANRDGALGDLLIRSTVENLSGIRIDASALTAARSISIGDLPSGTDNNNGVDEIVGGAGNDIIFGNGSLDRLAGGGGADIFGYNKTTDSEEFALFGNPVDQIAGLDESDRIDLSFRNLTAINSILLRPDDAFVGPFAVADFFGTADGIDHAVAVQYNAIDATRAYVDANRNGDYDSGDMVIEFTGNVKAFLDSFDDYIFA